MRWRTVRRASTYRENTESRHESRSFGGNMEVAPKYNTATTFRLVKPTCRGAVLSIPKVHCKVKYLYIETFRQVLRSRW